MSASIANTATRTTVIIEKIRMGATDTRKLRFALPGVSTAKADEGSLPRQSFPQCGAPGLASSYNRHRRLSISRTGAFAFPGALLSEIRVASQHNLSRTSKIRGAAGLLTNVKTMGAGNYILRWRSGFGNRVLGTHGNTDRECRIHRGRACASGRVRPFPHNPQQPVGQVRILPLQYLEVFR